MATKTVTVKLTDVKEKQIWELFCPICSHEIRIYKNPQEVNIICCDYCFNNIKIIDHKKINYDNIKKVKLFNHKKQLNVHKVV